ncbi:amidase [Rhodococcus jostii]|uniref:amidase n=1 Tax=Rhodococcus jostii TaxID=132919 RepID=UPI0036384415
MNELTWLPAWEIRDLIAGGDVSAAEVVNHFLGRIEEFQPKLHAFATLDPERARYEAAKADMARRRGEGLGPLHGLPISVKENLAVQDVPFAFPRTGTYGVSEFDAIAVERLRDAGAIVVGTNTMMGTGIARSEDSRPEAPTMSSYNWDAEARNPWDTSRVPGWSSSGGAAAASAALLPVTIGSDGGGSTRLPAAFSGVVGVHPTRGLVPHVDYRHPKFRLTSTNGPLARDVRDAALVMQVLAGPDARDYICIQNEPADFLAGLDAGVGGMRLAWTDDYGYADTHASPESGRVIAAVREMAFKLRSLGAAVETTDQVWEPSNRGGGPAPGEPSVYEIEVGNNPPPLPPVDSRLYREALEWRARNGNVFRDLFREYDLLLSVTSQSIAPTVEQWDEAWTTRPEKMAADYTPHTVLCNILGLPAVSVPCGFVDGMPVGLQIVGPPSSEDRIFRLASAFQRAFPVTERPSVG